MFQRVYARLLSLLRLKRPITDIAREYADTQSSEFGILMAITGSILTLLALHVPGWVTALICFGVGILYGHFFWSGFRWTRKG